MRYVPKLTLVAVLLASCGMASRCAPKQERPADNTAAPERDSPGAASTTEPPTAPTTADDETTDTRDEPAAPPPTPTEVRVLGPRVESAGEITAWIAERIARARAGTRDFVRLPLAEKSDGWGCVCPRYYAGGSPDAHQGGETWLRVVNESGTPLPEAPTEMVRDVEDPYRRSFGQVVRVDGYFDGEVVREDLRDGSGGPSDWIYDLNVFHVTRVHRRMNADRAYDARVALLGDPVETGVCERVVRDDNPPLNVRARPNTRAEVVGGLDDGARITPVEWRGHRWIRIEDPVSGWLWADSTARACD